MGHVLKAASQPPPRMVTVILLPLPGQNMTSQHQAKPLHSWPEVTLKPARDRGSGQGRDRSEPWTVPLLSPAGVPMNCAGPGESISLPAHCPGMGSQTQPMEGVPCLSQGERSGLA